MRQKNIEFIANENLRALVCRNFLFNVDGDSPMDIVMPTVQKKDSPQLILCVMSNTQPCPGTTTRYGGHTTCVEVRSKTDRCLMVDSETEL